MILLLIGEAMGCATLVMLGALALADRVCKRQADRDAVEDARASSDTKAMRAAIAEKRRLVERDRTEWSACLDVEGDRARAFRVTNKMADCDAKLIALADEEARIPRDDA